MESSLSETLPQIDPGRLPGRLSLILACQHALRRFDLRTVALVFIGVFLVSRVAHVETVVFDSDGLRAYEQFHVFDLAMLAIVPCIFIADGLVEQGARPFPTYAAWVLLGAGVASTLQLCIRLALHIPILPFVAGPLFTAGQPFYVACNYLVYCGAATLIYVYLRSALTARSAGHRAEIALVEAQRKTIELRLQSMQARVNPSFLFETLDAVGLAYESDADQADRLLNDLITFLRAALPRSLESPVTVEQEVELLRAYLDVQIGRRTHRLEVGMTIFDGVETAHLPPMLMMPLVDHLLAQCRQEGAEPVTMQISLGAIDSRLALSFEGNFVSTSMRIPDALRQRLTSLFGDAFRVTVIGLAGTAARILVELPLVSTDRRHR